MDSIEEEADAIDPGDSFEAELEQLFEPTDPEAAPSFDEEGIAGGALRVESEIGCGGMGRVYLVHDERLERPEALKILPTQHTTQAQRDRFEREARIAGRLEHPNIVPVHKIGETPAGQPYFTMKFVRGDRLDELIGEGEAPSPSRLIDLLEIFTKTCDAVAFAHSRGVVHLDIKPQNIMVGEFGEVYLMDWGIAKIVDRDLFSLDGPELGGLSEVSRVETLESCVGSPGYMAPEQAREGTRRLNARSDVFALGVVLYQLATGRNPFCHPSPNDIESKNLECEFRPPSELEDVHVPRELERMILRAMAEAPADRYASVRDLKEDVQRFVYGEVETPTVEFDAGETVVGQGEPADALYVIESGGCSVYVEEGGEREHRTDLGPGSTVGETALLAETRRTATVVANEPTELSVVTRKTVERELDSTRPWVGRCLEALARRFEHTEERLRALFDDDGTSDPT